MKDSRTTAAWTREKNSSSTLCIVCKACVGVVYCVQNPDVLPSLTLLKINKPVYSGESSTIYIYWDALTLHSFPKM